MRRENHNDLWRDFPARIGSKRAGAASQHACGAPRRACGRSAGAPRSSARTADQASLTSGTVLEKTRKPFKRWFRAVFEISTRRTGISAKDLQRIMGFGSYEAAWTWLHKLRAAMIRSDSEPLGPFVQADEALVGGKGSPHKELVLVAAEANGRVRLAHVENNDKDTCKRFADGQIAADARVVTDGHAGYDKTSLGKRHHERKVQTKSERRENDTLQSCHWTISLLKRWLLGTHAGAVRDKHLQAYLDEFAFRHNRRKTNGVGRIAARVIEQLVMHAPLPKRQIIDHTKRCRWFASAQAITT